MDYCTIIKLDNFNTKAHFIDYNLTLTVPCTMIIFYI